jgi:hypothetical protein
LLTADGIQIPFLGLALFCLIIFGASADGVLAPVGIPTAEGAAQIIAAGIPWVSEKQDLTMSASGQALS